LGMQQKRIRPVNPVAVFVLALLTAVPIACGYRFSGGGALPAGVQTVFVSIFENRTFEMGLENTITRWIINEFTRRKASAPQDRADAVLSGVIRSMDSRSISRSRDETTLERRVTLVLDIELTDKDGRTLLARPGISESEAYDVSSDKQTTEKNRRDALDRLSERLGEKIYGRLTEDF
jgi:hypothetical protein